jgi:inositol transport system ATP-binding protein
MPDIRDAGGRAAERPLLELHGIEKSFPGVKALRDMSLTLRRGSVHVICGENGAGKSTLVKIVNGVYQPDRGEIRIDGERVVFRGPFQARGCGIAMISQELDFIPEMTVEQSLFLGVEPLNRLRGIDWRKIRRSTLALLTREHLPYGPTTLLKDLSVSDLQMLEILKAISLDSRILIMDEPTSALTNKEVEVLFQKIADLKAKGVGILYISHRMEEIFRIADEITVMRDGVHVETRPAGDFDVDTVIRLIVGRNLGNVYPSRTAKRLGEVMLEVDHFTRRPRFVDVGGHVRAGEIVGLAGLMGAGRTEVARALFGLDPYETGVVKIRGSPVRIRSVHDAISRSMAMLSEDRRRYGLISVRDVKENVTLAGLDRVVYGGWRHRTRERHLVSSLCDRMNVKAPNLETTVGALSGGNQQKVVFAKWMLRDPDILILDEPTRGVDVGAKYEIYKIMMELAREGKAILLISSELPELLGVSDRIYVMARGRVTGELRAEDASQEKVMRLATRTVEA